MNYFLKFIYAFLFFSTTCWTSFSYSQETAFSSDSSKKIIAKFDTLKTKLREGEIISKVLKITNPFDKAIDFSVDIAYPAGWKTLNSRTKLYNIGPRDSLFVPVRIIPHGRIRGNTKYLINAYVLEKDSTPIATANFYATRERISNWDITLLPNNKIYFKNKENESKFEVGVLNLGNEEQELVLDIENNRNDLIILDTTEKVIKKKLTEIKLNPNGDTSFTFIAKYTNGIRNYRLIDTETHKPNSIYEPQTYTLFVKTSEPRLKSGKNISKARKMDFVRLTDNLRANTFGRSVFPLIMDANVTNIFAGQPILNLNFRGNTTLQNGANVNYFTQTFFTSPFYTNQYVLGSFYYLGYFMKNYSVQIGDVGGVGGGLYASPGRGIVGTYSFRPRHTVGAYYTRNPKLFGVNQRNGFGVVYMFNPDFGNYSIGYSRINNTSVKLISNYINLNGSYKLGNGHSVNAGGVFVLHNSSFSSNTFRRQGFIAFAGYTGTFLDKNLRSNLTGNYYSKYFDPNNAGNTIILNHSSSYRATKKWNLQLTNNYNRRDYKPLLPGVLPRLQSRINNVLSATRKMEDIFLGGGIFYNIVKVDGLRFHSRGLTINSGTFDFQDNTLISSSINTGYTRALDQLPKPKDYFFFQFFAMYRYRVMNANFRYTYGNIGAYGTDLLNGGQYPQNIAAAVNYQYQFKDPHFVLQNYFNYSYFNRFQRHNFGYTPNLFYYTNSGWRISLLAGFFISRSSAQGERVINGPSDVNFNDAEAVVTRGFTMNVGVRKEFGIPNPFSKNKFYSIDFISFVDINGNGKKDAQEPTLENIVIRLDRWEVLTNEKGKASIKNIPQESYKISAFSLDELDGFFPYLPEGIDLTKNLTGENTLAIPFVKGIKIYGKVVLDREKIAKNIEAPIDLSGIKIAAINGKTIHTLTDNNGEFNFYVPYGKYVLNLDENILSDRFRLLQNNIELSLDKTTESLFITFYIVEKRRKINKKQFGSSGNLLKSEEIANGKDTTAAGKDAIVKNSKKDGTKTGSKNAKAGEKNEVDYDVIKDAFVKNLIDATKLKGLVYTIQLGAFQKPLNPSVFKDLKGLMYERIDNNFVRISGGQFDSESAATLERDNIRKNGFKEAFVSVYYNGKVISLQEAEQIKKALQK